MADAEAAVLSGRSAFEVVSAIAGTSEGYAYVFTTVPSRHTEIALSDFHDRCGNGDFTGHTILIDLFENPMSADARVQGAGDFPIFFPQVNGGPVPQQRTAIVTYVKVTAAGGELMVAQTGSVSVSHLTEAGLDGSLNVQFADGDVAGRFHASFCTPWTRSAVVPGASGN